MCLFLATTKLLDRAEPGLNFFSRSGMNDHSQEEALKFSVYRVLFDFGIRVDWITGDHHSKTVLVPADLPIVAPYTALVTRFGELGGDLIKAESNTAGDRLTLEVGLKGKSLFQVTLLKDPELKRFAGKIAIVIDDFGYSFSSLVRGFINLDYEITISILPGLDHSQKIAQAAFEAQRNVMLHLPMEAKNDEVGFDGLALRTGLSETEIRDK